jgi:hypothetical protein
LFYIGGGQESARGHPVAFGEFEMWPAQWDQFAVREASDHGGLRVFGAPDLEAELAHQTESLRIAERRPESEFVFDHCAPQRHATQDTRRPGLPQDVQAVSAVESA